MSFPSPPAGRSRDSLQRHYDVERAIAARLKAADRDTRKEIYGTMYDELFAQVPDHPRLVRRSDRKLTERHIHRKTQLLSPFIDENATFLEFGTDDCQFAFTMASRFRKVYAIDIADQIAPGTTPPGNFGLIIYDRDKIELPGSTIDVAFSDQLIEHLNPEDTLRHFQLVHRLLKPGGVYAFRTPHRLTGPHDVSRYFSDQAEGFHLKEWTYGELSALLDEVGFCSTRSYWFGRGLRLRLSAAAFELAERLFSGMSSGLRRKFLPYLLPRAFSDHSRS